MKGIRWRIRLANITLAIFIPVLFVGVFLLRDADEVVIQAFGMSAFFSSFVLQHLLEARYERRHQGRDERSRQ
jgi:hypothetical protein